MIYLDNAATTRPCAEAVAAANEAMQTLWGNPSSLHKLGVDAARLLRRSGNTGEQGSGKADRTGTGTFQE